MNFIILITHLRIIQGVLAGRALGVAVLDLVGHADRILLSIPIDAGRAHVIGHEANLDLRADELLGDIVQNLMDSSQISWTVLCVSGRRKYWYSTRSMKIMLY